MAILKCKMCGGNIILSENESIGVCDSCGTKQTITKINDEKIINMIDRANHFRINNDYDKAMKIYEDVLIEDSSDSEVYWNLVLCKYGIEYVEDNVTKKRIPTINRMKYELILNDDDYKKAIELADDEQRILYEQEAKYIGNVQQGILDIIKKEKPYDVFICYKETDDKGRRTKDSVLANDLYHQLTKEGYNVFFAKISLEDKLGEAYEPYIFAALNSSKVMIVLGTKPEYFNAVWVKNEWSRFLSLIKSGKNKVLIPAYKDMDPYDLPDEFCNLQAQDMNKLGFIQDIIHGINKIENKTYTNNSSNNSQSAYVNNNEKLISLKKRIKVFLEEEEFEEADRYCEKALDIDAEDAEAYLYKLLAELKVKNIEELKLFSGDLNCCCKNYKRIFRFCDEDMKHMLEEINNKCICNKYISLCNDGDIEKDTELYDSIISGNFSSSNNIKDYLYDQYIVQMKENNANKIKKIYDNMLIGYKDCDEKIKNIKLIAKYEITFNDGEHLNVEIPSEYDWDEIMQYLKDKNIRKKVYNLYRLDDMKYFTEKKEFFRLSVL